MTVLAGGVGAARLLRGLSSLLEPGQLTVIVNTADDEIFHGLHVSPDVDTILYTLAGLSEPKQGWGRRGDTFRCLDQLRRFYPDTWFRLGDLDLATHIYRTEQLRAGRTLTTVTRNLARALGVQARVLPMTDARVRTFVTVAGHGALPFQDYLVRRRGRGAVTGITARGARRATPAGGVLAAIADATDIILPPSNPFVSIGPILALPGVRQALRETRARIAAVSPLIHGRPIKGPLDRMLSGLGHQVSSLGVAKLYRDFVDLFVLDEGDAALAPRIAALGMAPLVTSTLMSSTARSRRLAGAVLEAIHG